MTRGSVLCLRPNLESCLCRAVSSHSSYNPQEVLLAQFSLYGHRGGIKPPFFHSFVHSFIHQFIHLFVHFFFIYSFIHSFNNAFIYAFIHTFNNSFIYAFIHRSTYSRLQLVIILLGNQITYCEPNVCLKINICKYLVSFKEI